MYKNLDISPYLCTMKQNVTIALAAMLLLGCNQNKNMNTLTLTQEWDKTFPKSELVHHSKVTFHNRFGIELAADMYVPKEIPGQGGNDVRRHGRPDRPSKKPGLGERSGSFWFAGN